jgi:hypothetical protein
MALAQAEQRLKGHHTHGRHVGRAAPQARPLHGPAHEVARDEEHAGEDHRTGIDIIIKLSEKVAREAGQPRRLAEYQQIVARQEEYLVQLLVKKWQG